MNRIKTLNIQKLQVLDEANFVSSINAPSGITLAGGNFTGSASELTDLPIQQQADWLALEDSVSFIRNKPNIPDLQQADWDAPAGSPAAILNKPDFTDGTFTLSADWAATTGITMIVNKPNLAAIALSGQWSDLAGKPLFAPVAFSGSYSDLTGSPTSIDYSKVTNTPRLAAIATSGTASNLLAGPLLIDLLPSGLRSIGSSVNTWQYAFFGSTSTNTLTSGNAAFSGSLLQTALQSTVSFASPVFANDNLNVSKQLSANTLQIGGQASLKDITITGSLIQNGSQVSITGMTTLNSSLVVQGSTTLSSTTTGALQSTSANITGSLQSNTLISGNTTLSQLTVQNAINTTLINAQSMFTSSSLTVQGLTSLQNVTVAGASNLSGTVSGASSSWSTLNVTGSTQLKDIRSTGNAVIGGTLQAGDTTLTSLETSSLYADQVTVSQSSSFKSGVSVSGGLSVDSINVSGVFVGSSVLLSSSASIASSLNVAGMINLIDLTSRNVSITRLDFNNDIVLVAGQTAGQLMLGKSMTVNDNGDLITVGNIQAGTSTFAGITSTSISVSGPSAMQSVTMAGLNQQDPNMTSVFAADIETSKAVTVGGDLTVQGMSNLTGITADNATFTTCVVNGSINQTSNTSSSLQGPLLANNISASDVTASTITAQVASLGDTSASNLQLAQNFSVTGSSTLASVNCSTLTSSGNLSVGGNATLAGGLSISGSIVCQSLTANADLTCSNDAAFLGAITQSSSSPVIFNGSVSAASTLNVSGPTTLNSALQVGGPITNTSTQSSTFSGPLVAASVQAVGLSSLSNLTTGNLTSTGVSKFMGPVLQNTQDASSFTGPLQLFSTLSCRSTVTLNNGISLQGGANIDTLSVSSTTNIGSTLSVLGNSTFTSDVLLLGNAEVQKNLVVDGSTALGALSVSGNLQQLSGTSILGALSCTSVNASSVYCSTLSTTSALGSQPPIAGAYYDWDYKDKVAGVLSFGSWAWYTYSSGAGGSTTTQQTQQVMSLSSNGDLQMQGALTASSMSVSGITSASALKVTDASSLGSVTVKSLSQTDSGAPVSIAGPTSINNTMNISQLATFNAISAQSITVQSDVVFSDLSTNNITFGGTLQQTSTGSITLLGPLSISQLTSSGSVSLSSLSCSGSSAFSAPLSLSSSLLQTNSASTNTIAGPTSFSALVSASSGITVSAPILISASDGSFQVPNSVGAAGHTVAWNRNGRGVASFVNAGSSSSPKGWEWISCSGSLIQGYQVDNSGAYAMTLSPSGNIAIPGTLTANALSTTAFNATGQSTVVNLSVSSTLLVSGASTFSQPLTLSSMINQTDSTKTSSFAGPILYSNSLTQSGNGLTTFSGGVVANSNLTVSGATSMATLTIQGASTLGSSSSSICTLPGSLLQTGNTSTVTFAAPVTLSSSLNVGGITSLANASISGQTTLTNLTVNNQTTLSTLTVNNNSTFSGPATFAALSASSLMSTSATFTNITASAQAVTNDSVLNTIHSQSLNVAQGASILGATNLASLTVTGAAASQSLGVTGTSALGQTSITGVLAQASGKVTLGGSVSISSTLTVSGTLTANSPVQINNNSLTMTSSSPTLVMQGSGNTSASINMSTYNYGTYAPPLQLIASNDSAGGNDFLIVQKPSGAATLAAQTRLIIKAGTGNLGIGTTWPQASVDVAGTTILRGATTVMSTLSPNASASVDIGTLTLPFNNIFASTLSTTSLQSTAANISGNAAVQQVLIVGSATTSWSAPSLLPAAQFGQYIVWNRANQGRATFVNMGPGSTRGFEWLSFATSGASSPYTLTQDCGTSALMSLDPSGNLTNYGSMNAGANVSLAGALTQSGSSAINSLAGPLTLGALTVNGVATFNAATSIPIFLLRSFPLDFHSSML